MGRVAESWRDYRDRESIQTFTGIDREKFPEIAALLCGQANSVGTGWERPPLSLLLYLEGDGCKYCFSSKRFPMQLWGSCGALRDGLDPLEESLCRGHCDWRKKNEKQEGYSHR